MKSSLKLALVALVSAGLTAGAVYTYFRTTAGQGHGSELPEELARRAKEGGVPVVYWVDCPEEQVKDALRLDVRCVVRIIPPHRCGLFLPIGGGEKVGAGSRAG